MHDVATESGRTKDNGRGLAAPVSLFVLAVLIRALPITSVFHPMGIQFFGNDAQYHMRRIFYSLANFPAVLDFDPYISFPIGARPIWSPFFDWTIAALAIPLRTSLSDSQLESLIVWIPPLLGGGTVAMLYGLGRRHFGPNVALAAGGILAVLSGHFWYSQIGFVDHHAAVSLVSVLLLSVGMAFFAHAARRPVGIAVGLPNSLATGSTIALALLVWPGTLLHVGLLQTALLLYLLTRDDRPEAISLAGRMAVVHATATCLLTPFTVGNTWAHWSDVSPVVLSNFQPWYFATATCFSLACTLLWDQLPGTGETRLRRSVGALAIGSALVLVSLVVWPALWAGAEEAWRWFAKEESFQGMVGESAPLFYLNGQFTLRIALMRLSGFVLLAPLALAVAAYRCHRDKLGIPYAFFLWWTFGLLLATLFQKRFFNSASVPLALLFALSLSWVYTHLRSHPDGRAGSYPARAKGLCTAAALGLLIPTLMPYRVYVSDLYSLTIENQRRVNSNSLRHLEAFHLADWIRRSTPTTSGWLDADQKPEYCILAPWGIGHVLEYTGRRPTATDNFGDDIGEEGFQLAQQYFLEEEAEASRILDQLEVRYVVAPGASRFLSLSPKTSSMFASLHRFDGTEFKIEREGKEMWVPALQRHRLVYEWQPRANTSNQQSRYKLFEFVPGARIVGRAAPDADVHLILPVTTAQKRRFLYAARTHADENGRYALRVPYANSARTPTDSETFAVRPAVHYNLMCDGELIHVKVGEQAVVEGTDIQAPDLCLGN